MDAKKAIQLIEIQQNIENFKENYAKNEETSKNIPFDKIIKAKVLDPESNIFYERIKRIFELRRGCSLSVDPDNEILYGEIEDYGEKTPIFIKCDSSGSNEIEQNITVFREWVDNFYERKQATLVQNFQKIFYIHLDNVSITSNTNAIKVCSETDLVVSSIPVTGYLNKIIEDYENKKLPFSLRTEEEKQFSLAETFVPPSFNRQDLGISNSITLKNHLYQWLNEDASPS